MTVQTYVNNPHSDPHAGTADPLPTNELAPFDWGLGFALKHFGALFQLALVPALIKIAIGYLEFYRPLTVRQGFLIALVYLGAKTWLLVTIMLLSIAVLQGAQYHLWSFARRALLTMPKVLISSVALSSLVIAFFLAPWMYLFALFLIWAPLFVAAEIPAKSFRKDDEEEDFELEDEEIRSEVRMRRRIMRYFSDKPIWDLGFARSIQLTTNRRNFITTIQLALLFLVALTFPLATVVAFAGYYHGFGWVIFESIFSSVCYALVMGIACGTFLRLLPKDAFAELGILAETVRAQPVRKSFRLHGKLFPFFLIALIGGLATKATLDYVIVNNSRPPSLKSTLEKVEVTKQQIILTFQFEDKTNLFRWLNPQSFQLELLPDQPGPVSAAAPQPKSAVKPDAAKPEAVKPDAAKPEAAPTGTPEPKAHHLLEPQRVMPFTADGKPLPEDNFTPYDKPLRLVFYYENSLAEEQHSGKYVLYLQPLMGEPQPFHEGRFGS